MDKTVEITHYWDISTAIIALFFLLVFMLICRYMAIEPQGSNKKGL